MAFIIPGLPKKNGTKSGKKLGTSVNPVKNPSAPGTNQYSKSTNPRAAAPVPVTVTEGVAQKIVTESETLQAISLTGSSYSLPVTYDIVNIILNTSVTATTGASGAGSLQASSLFDHIRIVDAMGDTVVTIQGEQLHMLYERFSKYTDDFTDTAQTLGASGSKTATAVIQLPYLRLPAAKGPFSLQLYYRAYSSLGSWATNNGPTLTAGTDITAGSSSVGISVVFGDAQGGTSYISSSKLPVSVGGNNLSQRMPVQNASVAELIMYDFAADSDFDYLSINVNGQQIESELTEGELAARDEVEIQATRPTGLFWLYESTQIAFNSSSSFNLYLSSGATTTNVYFVFYRIA